MKSLLLCGGLLALTIASGCQTESASPSEARADEPETTTAPVRTETGENTEPVSTSAPVLTRLFWQDHESMSVRWADVYDGDAPTFGKGQPVANFPKLDPKRQKLVQMKAVDGVLLVGVRDDADGEHQSGWIAIDTGVVEEPHGNHSHWHYDDKPEVFASRLDDQQGNPAHVYLYDDTFYLANDRRNGYTQLTVMDLRSKGDDAGQFFPGGGNHITLATVDGKVGYSSWIDGGGPNLGRVDVTDLDAEGEPKVAYRFSLPTGVIHGAATAEDKVFFAPQDGICWVAVDPEADDDPEKITVHQIDLSEGESSDTPRRTGAFETDGRWLLFTTGKGSDAHLGILDASQEKPQPVLIDLATDDDHLVTTPMFFRAGRKRCAAIFLDYADPESDEELLIVQLDPNRDGDHSDSKILKRLTVGNSAVQGHFGHHSAAAEHSRDFLFVINPGDGTLSTVDLEAWTVGPTLPLTGQPASIISYGARAD